MWWLKKWLKEFSDLKKIDAYIIKNFLLTFFFILGILMLIACVFDYTEKMDDFTERNAPIWGLLFDYYKNFVIFYIDPYQIWDQIWNRLAVVISNMWLILQNFKYYLRYRVWKFHPA